MFLLSRILFICLCTVTFQAMTAESAIRYVALGDSYTIGTGAEPQESWPSLVTERLQKKGMAIELVSNLGENGFTTQDLISDELPELKTLQPDFVTLLIGVNDWVQGVSAQTFRKHFAFILSDLLRILPDTKNILIITIPDFSVTPAGREFANGRDIAQGIAEFNKIIQEEAEAHRINVVDLYPLSQTIGASYVAADGLHPSAEGHVRWAQLIEPAFPKRLP